MRVKLCSRCPYTPRDLAGHYDSAAALHVCAKCDGHEASTNRYPRKVNRRQQCATVLTIFATTPTSDARSVKEGLVSSGTMCGGPPSVRGNALIASGPVRPATAAGYAGFRPHDRGCDEEPPDFSRSSRLRNEEAAR
jgi:hypothetical protein